MIKPINEYAASRWLRFATHLIDAILIYVCNQSVIYVLTSITHVLGFHSYWITFFFSLSTAIAYYMLFELFFNRTVGKFITKTIVVTEQGKKPDAKDILIRTLCPQIPFDALSYLFGRVGWHDSISKTRVIRISDLELIELENTIESMESIIDEKQYT